MPEGIWEKQKIDDNKAKAMMNAHTHLDLTEDSVIESGDKILVCNKIKLGLLVLGEYIMFSYYSDIGSALQAKLN